MNTQAQTKAMKEVKALDFEGVRGYNLVTLLETVEGVEYDGQDNGMDTEWYESYDLHFEGEVFCELTFYKSNGKIRNISFSELFDSLY